MARSTALILLLMLASCQSTAQRAEKAAEDVGRTQASVSFPDPPPACIAKVGRVRVGDEPWVISFRRWEVVADLRDQQAADCAAWFADVKARWAK